MLSIEAKLTDLVSRMKEFAGENLESMILYGSAARGDFKEGHSDLNVLCVLRSVAARELTRVTAVVHWWCKDQNEPAPLFFTAEEVAAALHPDDWQIIVAAAPERQTLDPDGQPVTIRDAVMRAIRRE